MWMSLCLFLFKQKTAYEMRISDWSSDVCSSDLSSAGTGTGPPVRETAARVAHRTLQWRGVAAVLARPWWTGLVAHRSMVDLQATSRAGEESRPSGRDECSAGQPVALARPGAALEV